MPKDITDSLLACGPFGTTGTGKINLLENSQKENGRLPGNPQPEPKFFNNRNFAVPSVPNASKETWLPPDQAAWVPIAMQILAGEFDGADRSTRESLEMGLRSIAHPVCQRALKQIQSGGE